MPDQTIDMREIAHKVAMDIISHSAYERGHTWASIASHKYGLNMEEAEDLVENLEYGRYILPSDFIAEREEC